MSIGNTIAVGTADINFIIGIPTQLPYEYNTNLSFVKN